MVQASAPKRATGTLTIGFGLLSVPVQLFSGVEKSEVTRKMYSPAGNRIEQRRVDPETNEEVPFSDIVKKYETADGSLVDLTDEEMAAAAGAEASGDAQILGFITNSERGRYFGESVMQVRPAPGGNKKPSPANQKAFKLLMETLDAEDVFALVQFTTRGKPHLAMLTGDGCLRVVFYADEIREALPFPAVEITDAERDLAKQLLATMKLDEAIEVSDEASEKIRAYAEAKAAGGAAVTQAPTKKEADDIMAALAASLKAS